MLLLSLCDLDSFWWLLIWWLLPFLLGLLLGYLIWSVWKGKWEESQREVGDLKVELANLRKALDDCKSRNTELQNEISLRDALIREMSSTVDTPGHTTQVQTLVSQKPQPSDEGLGVFAGIPNDYLQVVEGIGPKMDSILKANGVKTISDLANASTSDIQQILDSFGNKYRIIDPVTWSEQAGYADRGDWKGLIARQKELSGGTLETSQSTDSKVEKVLVKLGLVRKWKKDDLKAIEGIGPKIESLLRSNGIETWAQLANAEVKQLNKILEDAGDRFQLADPTTWPQQAGMAERGEWKELERYQDLLDGGRES